MPKLDEILADAGKTLGVRRIYGDPYEKNGVTVIPAARVMGGAGGGVGAEEEEWPTRRVRQPMHPPVPRAPARASASA